jgi:putative membrane protein
MSVVGTALLLYFPAAVARAGLLLPVLMKVPTWTYMAVLPLLVVLVYAPALGVRRTLFFIIWGGAVGLGAELLGTSTGIPFGAYGYTEFLGPKILGLVPYLIPLSWFAMATLSLDLATRLRLDRPKRVLAAALYMVCWDLALDPAMGYGFPVWRWEEPAAGFYGMPVQNLLGWFLTASIIAWGYEFLAGGLRPRRSAWPVRLWVLSAFLPLGISLVRGMVPAVVVGGVAVALPLVAVALRRKGLARRVTGAVHS